MLPLPGLAVNRSRGSRCIPAGRSVSAPAALKIWLFQGNMISRKQRDKALESLPAHARPRRGDPDSPREVSRGV